MHENDITYARLDKNIMIRWIFGMTGHTGLGTCPSMSTLQMSESLFTSNTYKMKYVTPLLTKLIVV